MKKRILIISTLLALILIVIILVLVLNKDAKPQNTQTTDFENNSISETKIDNGLIITNSNSRCYEQVCSISMIAKNDTPNNIDMTNYRISFIDNNGEEVYWFNGTAIGVVEANTESLFVLEVPKSVSEINKIIYIKN